MQWHSAQNAASCTAQPSRITALLMLVPIHHHNHVLCVQRNALSFAALLEGWSGVFCWECGDGWVQGLVGAVSNIQGPISPTLSLCRAPLPSLTEGRLYCHDFVICAVFPFQLIRCRY